jgi:hypothetical protein
LSKEGDHHYVPQFHLRMWERPDGKISQWGRIPFNDKLVCTPVTSAATAYIPGLYSLEHVSEAEAQQIERDIFGKIETEAKPVLAKLINQGPARLSVRERYWWTIYLNASLLRVPHVVEKVKAGAKEIVEKELSQNIPEYDAAKGDAPETTLFEWAAKHAPARLANSGLKVLVSLLRSEKAIDRIIHLRWLVKDVSSSPCRLLLGDNPFERVGDLYKPRTLISIPLSPTHVFFGSDALDIIENLVKLPVREIIKASNVSTLTTARKHVYGSGERDFIERYLLRSV